MADPIQDTEGRPYRIGGPAPYDPGPLQYPGPPSSTAAEAPSAPPPAPAAPSAPTPSAPTPSEPDPNAQPTVNLSLTGGRPPATADLARQGLLAVSNPAAMRRRITGMEESAAASTEAAAAKQYHVVDPMLAQRQTLETQALQHWSDYQAGLKMARPKVPEVGKELQRYPDVPDVKVRPWLDPEGKSQLSVIVQGLSMLATGVGGLAIGAPKTALRQFKEAADAWRQDEIDRAQSNWKDFQGTVEKIRGNNEQALQVYEMLDKQFGANLLAKQASAVVSMEKLGLHDQAMQAAMLPYDQAIKAHNDAVNNSAKILESATRFTDVMVKMQRYGDELSSIFGSPGKLDGYIAGLQRRLQDDDVKNDPELKQEIERKLGIATTAQGNAQKRKLEYAETVGQSQAGVRLAGTQLPKAQTGIEMVSRMTGRLKSLETAYQTLDKAGALPPNPSTLSEGMAWLKRQGRWTPETAEAWGVVNNFFSQVNVTEARVILQDVGARFKGAYGQLSDHPAMPYRTWVGIRKEMAKMLSEADVTYRTRQKTYLDLLGMPEPAESTPPPDDDGE